MIHGHRSYTQFSTTLTDMTIFWMKARSGWREKHEVEHTGDGVRSPQFVIYAGYPQGEELTPDAWAERYRPDGRASSTEGPPTITVPEIE